MSYVNLPRTANPRGLGDYFDGFGSWVVDRPWGLSPSIIPGQSRPYGTSIIQTHYPRAQTSRFLDMNRFVVAGGTWPNLLPANSPVFRTPVMQAGVMPRDTDIPPNMGLSGAAGGFGWIPQGVAQPPFEMLEPRMKGGGYRGFSQGDVALTDQQKAELVKVLRAYAIQWVSWHTTLKAWRYAIMAYANLHTVTSQEATAAVDKQIFGSTARREGVQAKLEQLEQTRTRLIQSGVTEELGGVPSSTHEALDVFLGRIQDTPDGLSGFGGIKITKAGLKKLLDQTKQSVWFERTVKYVLPTAILLGAFSQWYRYTFEEDLEAKAAVGELARGGKVAVDSMALLIEEDKKRLATATPEEAAAIIERSKLMAERITDINSSAAEALKAANKMSQSKTFWIWAFAIGGAALLYYMVFPGLTKVGAGLGARKKMVKQIGTLQRKLTRAQAQQKPRKRKRKTAAAKPAAAKKAAPGGGRKKAKPRAGLGGGKPRARARITYKK